MNGKFTYITKTKRFNKTQWFNMMTNTSTDMKILITNITRIYRFTES